MVYTIDDGQRGHPGRHFNATGFPTLALELVYEIVSYFETMRYPYTSNEVPIPSDVLEGWRVLKALSETCRALRVKCRPLLWQNVVCAAGYRRHHHRVDASRRGGNMSSRSTRMQLEGRIERELDAVTGLLSGKTGIGDLGQYVQFLTVTIPPTSSEETIISLAECFSKLTNLQTLQIIGPTSPLVGQIFTTTSSSSSSPSSSSISNIFAYDHHPKPSSSPASSPPSSSSPLSLSSSTSSISNRDRPINLLPNAPENLKIQPQDRVPVHCPSLKSLLLDSTTYEIISCFPNLVRLYCSFHTFFQRQGESESLDDSSSPSTGEPEPESEPSGLPRHFNVHAQLPSTLSEGVLRRLADIVDAEEQEDEEEEQEVGSSSSTGNSGLAPPILSELESELPFPFTLPNSLSPFGANPNPNPNPTNSTYPFAPPPLPMDPVNPLDTVHVLGLDRDGVGDRDREEEQRMREVQWKIIKCIREGGVKAARGHVPRGRGSEAEGEGEGEDEGRNKRSGEGGEVSDGGEVGNGGEVSNGGDEYKEGTMGTGGWSLEVFEMGGPGVEEDGEMWVVKDEGRQNRERRDEEGDEEKSEKDMYPLEGSLIRAIVKTMPNLRKFPKIHVHPETPVSLVSYAFYSLPYLSSFHINPSEPLDPSTIEFIAACTCVIGQVAAENGTGSEPTLGASVSASTMGRRNTSSMGKRKKNMGLMMQMGDWVWVLPILGEI
ncbi:hypothetical protein K435DRAFT_781481 [Dendrothele bispora CBS 962.96]|uniref:Uncharacterized protein n=1 Tax=Dendrothele bispora (strain CBS 962.96) TaxID=1314807 RepID=A0A4S8LL02_DENBC|nr:hypothetical protein K435DRAFT_781481 [Dendrothele bispora CBS 962.96]